MTVTLEPHLTRSFHRPRPDWREEVLTQGPLLLRTPGQGRWHRPRSGLRYIRPEDQWDTYQLWCGQGVSTGRRPRPGAAPGLLGIEGLPDDGVPLCGTCEGRAIGAGHQSVAVTVTAPAGLLFQPSRLDPPKVCPGSGDRSDRGGTLWRAVDGNWRIAKCLVCGNLEPIRGRSDYAGGWMVIQKHAPGPDLTPGCPRHAWWHLIPYGGHAICACALPADGDA